MRIIGGLLTSEVRHAIATGDQKLPGTAAQSYGLERGESVRRQASRSWLYLLETWQEFTRRIDQATNETQAAEARSARATRERWLHILLRELSFRPVPADGAFEVDGKNFPVSHRSGQVPIHLLGYDTDLDHRTPKVTARAPQSMVQDLLNRSEAHLWALLSNGAKLRVLRDSATLTGSAYLEFDLEAIFNGEFFADFVLLYLICHESRFAAYDGGPENCLLEQWHKAAAEQDERALDELRKGVQNAISTLGTGFLSHPDNPQLRNRLSPETGDLRLEDLNRALLRLVYRLIFWFVAEDRGALLEPDPPEADHATQARLREARDRYAAYFSSRRLRRLARRLRGDRHEDLFESVRLVFDGLGTEGGLAKLALPALGGIFESADALGVPLPLDEPLAGARLSNEALLGAVRALSIVPSRSGGGQRRVDFGNLGAEELGSVYESLLELTPRYDHEQLSYTLETIAGNERKETGSYYTPTPLVDCLLDSALDPLLDQACAHPTAEERKNALLAITICDPACGSGHFLVAAARRLAKRVAAEDTGEPEPPPAAIQAALRRVAGQCIYGVDLNPMAAELAKVSLWLETLEPGKPLSFLDTNIRVGNSLLGVTPALLAQGLRDAAFTPIEGDDKKIATELRKQNAKERGGQDHLFSLSSIPVTNAPLAKRAAVIAHFVPDSLEDLHIQQQRRAEELAASAVLRTQKLLADAWCAAFVQPKTAETRSSAITHSVIQQLAGTERTFDLVMAEDLVNDLTRQYRFFHWHTEFPHIFRVGNGTVPDPATGWSGGFTCVLGNPPWERVKLQEQEFFAARDEKIAKAPNAAARKKLIADLATTDERLYAEFQTELRKASGWSHLLRESERYPLTGQGDINTYAVFAETARTIIEPSGRAGLVLPTGIATDATTAPFFSSLVRTSVLVSFLDFENEAFLLNRAVHHSVRFCLLTMAGSSTLVRQSSFAFGTRHITDLQARRFAMPPADILLVNPNNGTCPTFRSRRDAEVIVGIYKRVPVLIHKNPPTNSWNLVLTTMYHMTNDATIFRDRDQLAQSDWMAAGNQFIRGDEQMLPLYEARMAHQFNHRYGTYEGQTAAQANMGTLPHLTPDDLIDPDRTVMPRYWVPRSDTDARLARRYFGCTSALLGHRRIARSTDERSCIATLLPWGAASYGFILTTGPSAAQLGVLSATYNAFIYDYLLRNSFTQASVPQSTSEQLPVPTPSFFTEQRTFSSLQRLDRWILDRVLELTFTSWDMEPFAHEIEDEGAPFIWDENRRTSIRAELDAAYFHLYGLQRDEVEHVMDSFEALRRREEKQFDQFRTKLLILDRYDAMTETTRAATAYQSVLDPPPGQGPRQSARASV
jgi:hypothetical protein